jgi:hypothetical protein
VGSRIKVFDKKTTYSEEGKKYYSQHDSRLIIVVTAFSFMIIMVMTRFKGYVLFNIKLCVGCDSRSAPKKN